MLGEECGGLGQRPKRGPGAELLVRGSGGLTLPPEVERFCCQSSSFLYIRVLLGGIVEI